MTELLPSDLLFIDEDIPFEWMPFEQAREFVHTLCLKNHKEWLQYSSENRPKNIPSNPYESYRDNGWISWGDWLGTGTISAWNKNRRPFNEARDFVQSLKLSGLKDWRRYCKSGKKPEDIPAHPWEFYTEWVSLGDFLGTGYIHCRDRVYKTFIKARSFVRDLHFSNSQEWRDYAKSKNKPVDIPADPGNVYKGKGWIGYNDWLRPHTFPKNYRELCLPFEESREFAKSLGLKTAKEWKAYCNSGKKPNNIPRQPWEFYKEHGWLGMRNWLGRRTRNIKWIEYSSFENSRNFVRSLGLKSSMEWKAYARSVKKPQDIHGSPWLFYKNKGWVSMQDWLGAGKIWEPYRVYRPFPSARKFVHKLKIKSQKMWIEYRKSGNKPEDIPATPQSVYKNKGWVSWGDWFGTGFVATSSRNYRTFEEARDFVRTLKITSLLDWSKYVKSGKLPSDIPRTPVIVYEKKGWTNWFDFLGYKSKRGPFLPFIEARAFARCLNLKTQKEWQEHTHSDKRHLNIPVDPRMAYKGQWISMADWLGTAS